MREEDTADKVSLGFCVRVGVSLALEDPLNLILEDSISQVI
jgi:hypothetical protein